MTLSVDIKANIRGSESLSKLANDIRDVQKVSGDLSKSRFTYFDTLKRDAEAYSSNLKDQILYIKEQINLDRQRATEGHRERNLNLQEEIFGKHGRARTAIQRRIFAEKRAQGEMTGESRAAGESLTEWMRSKGIGLTPDAPGMFSTVAGGFAQGGVAGGTRGMLGSMVSKARGMGAVGLGVTALGAYTGYKAMTALSQGFGEFKSLEQGLVNIRGLMRTMPKDATSFRQELELAALASVITGKEFAGMAASWMKIASAPSANFNLIKENIRTGRAYGVSPDFSATYGARLARMGYWQMPDKIPQDTLRRGIGGREAAGLPPARTQEFLGLVEAVMSTVATTAGAVDISRMMTTISGIASLGEPFRGERGAQFMAGIHGGLTGGGGAQWLAAQKLLIKQGIEAPSVGKIEMKIAGGLEDPDFLEEMYDIAKGLSKGMDDETRALMFAGMMGQPGQIRLYDKLGKGYEKRRKESVRFMTPAGQPHLITAKEKEELDSDDLGGFISMEEREIFGGLIPSLKKTPLVPKTELEKRLKELEGSFGLLSMKYDIATDLAKIETAATLFEGGSKIFYDAINDFVENLLTPPTQDEKRMKTTEESYRGIVYQ